MPEKSKPKRSFKGKRTSAAVRSGYHFKNLVFEGGGVKGIGYVGALDELGKRDIMPAIERVGGTSAGAIMAVMVGLNYSLEEIRQTLWNLDFNNFLDDSWGIVPDVQRLIHDYGWYKGDFFRKWMGGLIGAKTGNSESTFGEISRHKKGQGFRDIFLMGTNLSTHFGEVFSPEHTPRTCIADAVRISMSIPVFFAAKRSLRGDVYVDGGVLANYPVKLFDREKYLIDPVMQREPDYYREHNRQLRQDGITVSKYIYNKETLGFRLDSAKEIAVFRDHAEPEHEKIDNFFSYGWALIHTIMENQQNGHLHDDDWQRTIYIDTLGVKTTQFDLSEERKSALIDSGRKGVVEYFKWFDNNRTANQP